MALKEKYGAKTLFSSESTYRSDHLWARTRFFNLFGNPGNVVDPGTICWCWNYSLNMAMVGWPVEAIMPVSPAYTGTIVNWGKRWSEAYAPEGMSRDEISQELCISESTVKSHLSHMYREFGVKRYSELIALAAELGIS